MNEIILHITQAFLVKVLEKTIKDEGIIDIDALSSELLTDCKEVCREIIQEVIAEMNKSIREDKEFRKKEGLVLKEKNRPRQILTELGSIEYERDYFYDKGNACHCNILDKMIGVKEYERVGDEIKGKLVSLATDMSYAKSAEILMKGQVSRQTVRNSILALPSLEKSIEIKDKNTTVTELHIYADEDHVHMQKPGKAKGKKNKIVPLVTVTEGTSVVGTGRNKTINPMHFVDEKFNTQNIWESVEGYIYKAYDIEKLEKIYIHADGGRWIKTGLEGFSNKEYVMDAYHIEKAIKSLNSLHPGKNSSTNIRRYIKENKKKEVDRVLQGLIENCHGEKKKIRKTKEIAKYILGNWESIVRRYTADIPGSCTEGQVSHVLSKRFSRHPLGWSEEGLGKLSRARVYVKNGGKITGRTFKTKEESYASYAKKVLKEIEGKHRNWNVFSQREQYSFNQKFGVQQSIKYIGRCNNQLFG